MVVTSWGMRLVAGPRRHVNSKQIVIQRLQKITKMPYLFIFGMKHCKHLVWNDKGEKFPA